MAILLALVIGIVAGLRTLLPLALIGWATRLGWLDLRETWLAFFGAPLMPWVFTVLAVFELVVVDQSPATPSRRVPVQFGARILSGVVCGGAIGAQAGMLTAGMAIGAAGAVAGTLGGSTVRERLARRLGKDRPAALLEDGAAIALAVLVAIGIA